MYSKALRGGDAGDGARRQYAFECPISEGRVKGERAFAHVPFARLSQGRGVFPDASPCGSPLMKIGTVAGGLLLRAESESLSAPLSVAAPRPARFACR